MNINFLLSVDKLFKQSCFNKHLSTCCSVRLPFTFFLPLVGFLLAGFFFLLFIFMLSVMMGCCMLVLYLCKLLLVFVIKYVSD